MADEGWDPLTSDSQTRWGEEEELEAAGAPPPPLILVTLVPALAAAPRPQLLVMGFGPLAAAFLHHLPGKACAGSVLLPEQSLAGNAVAPHHADKGTHLFFATPAARDGGALCVAGAAAAPPPDERAAAWAAALLARLQPQRVLLLDCLEAAEARKVGQSSAAPPVRPLCGEVPACSLFPALLRPLQLFALQTEAAASSTPPFPLLPPGPLHGGACAALLTLCAARRTPARAYLQVAGVEGAVGSAVAAAFAAALSAEAALAGLEGADAPDGAAAADAAAAAGALKTGRPVSTVYA